jgi:hypothetical protein
MTARDGVLDLIRRWGNDTSGRFRITLVAVRMEERRLLAHAHIGPLQGPPS